MDGRGLNVFQRLRGLIMNGLGFGGLGKWVIVSGW